MIPPDYLLVVKPMGKVAFAEQMPEEIFKHGGLRFRDGSAGCHACGTKRRKNAEDESSCIAPMPYRFIRYSSIPLPQSASLTSPSEREPEREPLDCEYAL